MERIHGHRMGGPPEQPEIPPPWRPEWPPNEPEEPPRHPAPPPVPLVPTPTEDAPDAHGLFGALLRRRIVFVTGALDHEVATRASAQVMTLDAEGDGPIQLHMASPDGDLEAALMLADTVELAAAPVTAVCRGALGGPVLAPFVLAGRRIAHPNATFRLSEPRMSLSGRADEIAGHAAAIGQQLAHLHARVAQATGRQVDEIAADMGRGKVLSAEEAHAYGLVHEVAGSDRTAWPAP